MSSGSGPGGRVFRLPASTYLVVLFVVFGSIPLAFTRSAFHFDDKGGEQGAPLVVGWHTLILLVPLAITVFIRRTATFVDGDGIRIRALLGSQRLPWGEIRGLAVSGRSVYAVLADGSIRLPCVRQSDLSAVSRASAGRLPPIADPLPKFAAQRRRRR